LLLPEQRKQNLAGNRNVDTWLPFIITFVRNRSFLGGKRKKEANNLRKPTVSPGGLSKRRGALAQKNCGGDNPAAAGLVNGN
jgi:hypothetical protein